MSEVKVNKISPRSGTAFTLGDSGDTFTVPTGAGLTVTDEVKTNKISPATGVAFTLGDSGDTFTVPSGATIDNLGTATGFGGLVKISTTSISPSTAQIDFDDLFSATYNKYFVCANDVEISSNAALQLYVLIANSEISADYSTASQAYDASGTSRSYGNTGLSRIAINSAANYAGTTYRHSFQFYIANPLGTDQWKTINGVYGGWTDQAANTAEVGNFSAAYRGATTALTGIRIATSNSATFDAGDVTLYGVAS